MTKADEVRALAQRMAAYDVETESRKAALRAYADLLDAAEELLRLKDGPRDDAYRAAKVPAWERLRKAARP